MGLLVDGVWTDQWYDTKSTGGRFQRSASQFRNWVTPDGSPGPTGDGGFAAEKGRYHLYVSYACPWAHRTLIFRKLKADSKYTGRVTVPILWDKKQNKLVSNESSEIIRMLNSAFDGVGAKPGDYYPKELQEKVDEVNSWVYDTVNNGVYKAGFATSQEAYDEAIEKLFESLDRLEKLLGEQRYLTGDKLTEADIRLWTTLIRFDPVYITHFKCDKKRILDYPNLHAYMREIYQLPGVEETVNFNHIRSHYFRSHKTINPTGVISIGPNMKLDVPHGRDKK